MLRVRPLLLWVQRPGVVASQNTSLQSKSWSKHSSNSMFTIANSRYTTKESKTPLLDYHLKAKEDILKKRIMKEDKQKPVYPDYYDGEESAAAELEDYESDEELSDSERSKNQFDYKKGDKLYNAKKIQENLVNPKEDNPDAPFALGRDSINLEFSDSDSEPVKSKGKTPTRFKQLHQDIQKGFKVIDEEFGDPFADFDSDMELKSASSTDKQTEDSDSDGLVNLGDKFEKLFADTSLGVEEPVESDVDSFAFEELSNENYLKVEDEAKTLLRDYDSEDIDEAADNILNPIPNLENQLNNQDMENFKEEKPFIHSLHQLQEQREKELEKIRKHEFRDIDKVFFEIMKEYKDEPIRVWKTLKHEELVPSFTNTHFLVLIKLFWLYPDSRHLIPDLFDWCKTQAQGTFNNRIYHYAILGMVSCGQGEKGIATLLEMEKNDIKPKPSTRYELTEYWSREVTKLCQDNDVEKIRHTLRYLRESRVYVNEATYHLIVKTYIEHGLLYQARDVLYKMTQDGEVPSKKYFAQLIHHYLDKNDPEEAQAVIEEMDACALHVPSSLSNVVTKALLQDNSPQAKYAEQLAIKRGNMKALNQQLYEVYKE